MRRTQNWTVDIRVWNHDTMTRRPVSIQAMVQEGTDEVPVAEAHGDCAHPLSVTPAVEYCEGT